MYRSKMWALALTGVLALLAWQMPAVAATYHVSTAGNDSWNGLTAATAFRTIQKGADMAQPGDTVLVHAGIYRERVKPPRGGTSEDARITYMAAPGEAVTITGLDPWAPTWTQTGNLHYATPDNSMFTDTAYLDGGNPYKIRFRGGQTISLGQVVVDGTDYVEQTSQSNANAASGRWYANRTTGAIYIHFPGENPTGHSVQITTRRGVFRPYLLGLGYITVDGFTMEYCANQSADGFYDPATQDRHQSGLIGTRSGHHWIIENNVIRMAKSSGLTIGTGGDIGDEGCYNFHSGPNFVNYGVLVYQENETPRQEVHPEIRDCGYNLIYRNVFDSCGQNGIVGLGHYGNVIYGNRFTNIPYLGSTNESAPIKVHFSYGMIVEKNLFENFTRGSRIVWLDNGPIGNRISRNVFLGRPSGNYCSVYLEILAARQFNMNTIDDNLFLGNNAGIGGGRADGSAIFHNLFYGCKLAFSMGSSRGDCGDTDICGCGAILHRAYNNLLIDNDANYGLAFRPTVTDVDSDYNILIPGGKYFQLADGGTGNPNWCGGQSYTSAQITARRLELGDPGSYWQQNVRWYLDTSNGPRGCIADFAAWKPVMDNIDQHTVERTKDAVTLGTRSITIDLTDDPAIGGPKLTGIRRDFNGNRIGCNPNPVIKAGPFQDLGLSPKTYTFWDDANLPELPAAPKSPSDFTVTPVSPTENALAWTYKEDPDRGANATKAKAKPRNATHFMIKRRQDGGPWITWGFVNSMENSVMDDQLDPGSTYEYRIAARNAGGVSHFIGPEDPEDGGLTEAQVWQQLWVQDSGQTAIGATYLDSLCDQSEVQDVPTEDQPEDQPEG